MSRLEDDSSNCSLLVLKKKYQKFVKDHLMLSKSLISAIIGGLGATIGTYNRNAVSQSSSSPSSPRRNHNTTTSARAGKIDWLEVWSFAIYGAIAGGPIGHFWDRWYEEHGPAETESGRIIFDQMIVQPPRLLLMFLSIDVLRQTLRFLPLYWDRALSHTSPTIVTSWRTWPIIMYIMLRYLKKRRLCDMAMNICSVVWVAYLTRHRVSKSSSLPPPPQP